MRLLDLLPQALRTKHYSYRTELCLEAALSWCPHVSVFRMMRP
jgi:hypothetical protein